MTQMASRLAIDPDRYKIEPGELNTNLIYDLIQWSEQDERLKDRFAGWGRWDQGTWANVDLTRSVGYDEQTFTYTGLDLALDTNVCGTAFCQAGQTAVQMGYRLVYEGEGREMSADTCIRTEPTDEIDLRGRRIFRDVGPMEDISSAAQEALGMDHTEADHYFGGNNTLPYLKARANGMCQSRGLPLLFPNVTPTTIGYYEWDEQRERQPVDGVAGLI